MESASKKRKTPEKEVDSYADTAILFTIKCSTCHGVEHSLVDGNTLEESIVDLIQDMPFETTESNCWSTSTDNGNSTEDSILMAYYLGHSCVIEHEDILSTLKERYGKISDAGVLETLLQKKGQRVSISAFKNLILKPILLDSEWETTLMDQ